jgi:uncharacterized cupredoxin-like copper-binding protein
MTRNQAGVAAFLTALSIALVACAGPTGASTSAAASSAQSAAQASPAAADSGTDAQTLTIATGDYYFKPEEITFRPGAIRLTVNNEGPRRHLFTLRNLENTDDIAKGSDRMVAGESETVTFTLTTEGRYKMYCSIPGHADRGEIGWIVISKS